MSFQQNLHTLLARPVVIENPTREALIEDAVRNKEAMVSACGALATWTPPESTGRSPKDTLTVKRPENEGQIDWDSPNNIPIGILPITFRSMKRPSIRSSKTRLPPSKPRSESI